MYKVVELFAGVGGFRVGLNKVTSYSKKTGRASEKKGSWEFVWSNQWEPSTTTQSAFNCYVTRFGEENTSNEDISKVDKTKIPNHDLLVGGFPCQDYSVARSISNELGIQGKKGVLWWEISKIINIKKPRVILLENVDRLLKSPANNRGRDFAIMLKNLEKLGYITQWRVINPAEYNMPQRRKRVFILATRKDIEYSQKLYALEKNSFELLSQSPFNKAFKIKDIDEKKVFEKNFDQFKDEVSVTEGYNLGKFLLCGIFINGKAYNTDIEEKSNEKKYTLQNVVDEARKTNENYEKYIISENELEKWMKLKKGKSVERLKPNGEMYIYSEGNMTFPDKLENPGRTMLTSEATVNRSSHIVLHDKEHGIYRKITEVEAELLQMFPADWTNTGMTARQRYFMMGNALVTGVVLKLEPELVNILSENKKD